MAIEGDGFFKVQNVSGNLIGYTRDGSFTRNVDGLLVNSAGITTRTGDYDSSYGRGSNDFSKAVWLASWKMAIRRLIVGQIELYRFANPTGLRQNGGNLFLATEASGPEIAGNPGDIGYGPIRPSKSGGFER